MSLRIAIMYSSIISRGSGTSERVLQIASGLSRLGADVTLLAAVRPSSSKIAYLNFKTIEIKGNRVKLRSFRYWLPKLIRSGLVKRYDIIQVELFSLLRSLILFFLMRPFSKKLVIVFHDSWFRNDPRKSLKGKLNLFIHRTVLWLYDLIITPGYSVKKRFLELHGEKIRHKIAVIPSGVPELSTHEVNLMRPRLKYKLDQHAFIALFYGLITFKPNRQAANYLYEVSDYVAREFEKRTHRKLLFVTAGAGSEKLPKTEHFIPIGFVQSLEELLSLPDVMVFPHAPSYTGPHVKTIYAFLSKKPVIATEDAVKDMPYVIAREHFLSFDIKRPASLLDALLQIYFDEGLRAKLTNNAYRYSQKFSWNYISYLHLKLYNSLLEKNSSSETS